MAPTKDLSTGVIAQIIGLKSAGHTIKEICSFTGAGPTSVKKYVRLQCQGDSKEIQWNLYIRAALLTRNSRYERSFEQKSCSTYERKSKLREFPDAPARWPSDGDHPALVPAVSDCETETLEHFILDCEEYSDIRQNHTFTHNPENQDRNNIIANILVFEKDLLTEEIENRKEYMIKIWKRRQSKIEEEAR